MMFFYFVWCFLLRRVISSHNSFANIVRRGYLPPLFLNPPTLWSPALKKIFSPPFPILFFQILNVVMLIPLAKSWGTRGASHQPAVMVSCLTIRHMCFPCLPSGRVSHCVPGFTEVGSYCYSRKWVWSSRKKLCCMASRKQNVGGRLVRWQGGKDRRVVRWEGERFLVLFKGGEHWVSQRFYLFVSDVNQGNEGAVWC